MRVSNEENQPQPHRMSASDLEQSFPGWNDAVAKATALSLAVYILTPNGRVVNPDDDEAEGFDLPESVIAASIDRERFAFALLTPEQKEDLLANYGDPDYKRPPGGVLIWQAPVADPDPES